MPRTGIALGSNLGDRLANLRAAFSSLREIASPGTTILCAPIYQTEPRLCPKGSPVFYNTVIEIDFSGSALELLEMTRALESQLGRTQSDERNAPRVIDIDLLYHGDEALKCATLVLPHPRIGERRFVLQPLADIRPSLILPGKIHTIEDLFINLASDEPPLVRLEECL